MTALVPTVAILDGVIQYSDEHPPPHFHAMIPEFVAQIRIFCGLQQVTVGAAEVVERALDYAERDLDLADALHLAQASQTQAFVTFDKPVARKAMRLAEVRVRLA